MCTAQKIATSAPFWGALCGVCTPESSFLRFDALSHSRNRASPFAARSVMTLSTSSRLTLFTTVFLSCVSFAIVLPSLWSYLQTLGAHKSFLAYVICIYSVGEALGALYFGAQFRSKAAKRVLQSAAGLGALGSVLYVLAYDRLVLGPYCVLFSRLLCGLWTGGAQAVQQAYLQRCLDERRLTSETVALNAWACIGFVVGPSFALLLSVFPPFSLPAVVFDELTFPAWFMLLSSVLSFFLYEFGLLEHRDCAHTYGRADGVVGGEASPLLKTDVDSEHCHRLVSVGWRTRVAIAVCNFAFFVHMFGFALQETITTPLVQEYYQWNVTNADVLFTAASVLTLLCFACVWAVSERVKDRVLTAISLVFGAVGWACLTPVPLHVGLFLTGFGFASVAFPLGRACVMSLASKLFPPEWQGSGQGVLLALGAVARIVAPFGAVQVFYVANGALIVFGGCALLFGVAAVGVRFVWSDVDTALES